MMKFMIADLILSLSWFFLRAIVSRSSLYRGLYLE